MVAAAAIKGHVADAREVFWSGAGCCELTCWQQTFFKPHLGKSQ